MPGEIQNGKLLGIAIKKAKRAPMILKEEATITTNDGVEGDYRDLERYSLAFPYLLTIS